MTISKKLHDIANDVRLSYLHELAFPALTDEIKVSFTGIYLQPDEDKITLIAQKIELKGKLYSTWDDEAQEVIQQNKPRHYVITAEIIHNACFENFCLYFEILATDFSNDAQNYFDKFKYYLSLLSNTANKDFNIRYRNHWREVLLRIYKVFEQNKTTFVLSFSKPQALDIMTNIGAVLTLVQPLDRQ